MSDNSESTNNIEVSEVQGNESTTANSTKKKKSKKTIIITISAICLLAIISTLTVKVIVPNARYSKAGKLYENGNYEEAIEIYEALGDYKDCDTQIKECTYSIAVQYKNQKEYFKAATTFYSVKDYKNAKEQCFSLWDIIAKRDTIAAGAHTVALKTDGTVYAAGPDGNVGRCDVSDWTDIIAVAANEYASYGLKADGTVVATGPQANDVSKWEDIVAISAGEFNAIGLKADGTVVKVGFGISSVADLNDIVAIACGSSHVLGLKSDGTVIAIGNNDCGQCNVSDWTDIVAISVTKSTIPGWGETSCSLGLKSDGTVLATGDNRYGQCDVSEWKNIVAVEAGNIHTVGLKTDGTIVMTGRIRDNTVPDWHNIVAISAGDSQTVGLKSNGSVSIAQNVNSLTSIEEAKVRTWNHIKLPNATNK